MSELKATDVLGLGCVAVDELLYLAAYPGPDEKLPVAARERHCGGLTATALVAAARLGASAAYAGVLGNDPDSRLATDRLAAAGVELSCMARRPEARPILSTILVDQSSGARTILYDLSGAVGAADDAPDECTIRTARVLLVDPLGIPGMIRAARIARAAGVPVVADFESDQHPRFGELLALVDHLVLSQAFAGHLTGERDPAAAAMRLWTAERSAVVITCGSAGCWWLDQSLGARPRHLPAFPVEAVDTTGCGDVFHGAYCAALAWKWPIERRLRFASAAAALKATRRGGQAGTPDRATVERFLERHA
jgi:sugar/nucleoside kinase (ribokinase family)